MARVTSEHHKIAEDLFNAGKNSPQVVAHLMKTCKLTKSQANDCKRTARVHLGIHNKMSAKMKAAASQAKTDADAQAEKKTEITQD